MLSSVTSHVHCQLYMNNVPFECFSESEQRVLENLECQIVFIKKKMQIQSSFSDS